MFPIIAIEQFYKNHLDYQYDPDAKSAIGAQCTQWLLSFTGRNPYDEVLQAIKSEGGFENEDRFIFAMAMALCSPSEQTPVLMRRFKDYIDLYSWNVGTKVGEIASFYNSDFEVDVLKIFSSFSKDLYEIALKAYRVDIEDLRDNAVAWDNLGVLLNTLDEKPMRGRYQAMFALAGFAVDPTTRIHQAVVKNAEDDEDLLFYRLLRVRHQLVVNYTNGVYWRRCDASSRVTLKPDKPSNLRAPSLQDTVAVHNEPGFCEQIKKDPVRFIQCFFAPMGQSTPSKVNQEQASQVTQEFLKAGIRPDQLLTYGLFEQRASPKPFSLMESLKKLSTLEENDQALFDAAYKAYLKDFQSHEIIKHCNTPEMLAAVYRLTGDKSFLQAGNDKTRSLVMGLDLGL
ncbi:MULTISPECIES: hypothetical protein [Pseudomonas]|uniref:hypothetical protein n=1 Tax=Pseudomonas TaxID=286 RepID=UPI000F015100|nr:MULTISPECIES: hypothetical protein [Pseudomonas]MBD8615430.1 hypothetical protein [Pseudomonas putida]MBD8681917.1 hypothetical protein [Pseudomonas sp. CFBP 13719]